MIFKDRQEAGRKLAKRLKSMSFNRPLILALPRGGVPIGYEIAQTLKIPLDVLVVRKIGAPFHREFGIGAITEGGYYWVDEETASAVQATPEQLEKIITQEHFEVERRVVLYRGGKPLPKFKGRSIIVVDDGLATGVTARVGCHYLKEQGADQVILAIPVCSPRTASFLRSEVDQVICLDEPEFFAAVGQFYQDFSQTTDEEVVSLLKKSKAWSKEDTESSKEQPASNTASLHEEVTVSENGVQLPGLLAIPENAKGLVLFAHGSGSGRLSPRNQQVADTLNEAGFGTLLFDLLTPAESLIRSNVFDIPLLASRLVAATNWIKRLKSTKNLPIGYFGASTGGGAALWAAADLKKEISAVVSRGGRPDLAIPRLREVTAPTLLLVGGWDEPVIQMNQDAMPHLANARLTIIPEATHVFEEPGKLEEVAKEAVAWFSQHLVKRSSPSTSGLRRSHDPVIRAIRERAMPLRNEKDIASLVEDVSRSRIVMLGEASHGTHEFYEWRRIISERLIEDHGFNFIAVEGDWPPCWELNRYIRSQDGGGQETNTREVLRKFNRWPTWMWANTDIIRLGDWLRAHNQTVPESQRAGFHGLDVYSLFESIDAVLSQLEVQNPFLAKRARLRYACFDPFHRDELAYAKSLLQLPAGCEKEVNENLQELLRSRLEAGKQAGDALFNAEQNARVIANAEHYYRTMIHSDDTSWNVRDRHMLDTLDVLLKHYGKNSKGIVWAHNTHIGDYRATDMAMEGQVNIGGLAREKWGESQVSLVGFGTYQGEVTASHAWDGPIETMVVPPGRPGSIEASFHEVSKTTGQKAFYISLRDAEARTGSLSKPTGHRAIGVVYHPEQERFGNYVPTSLSHRYDAFVFVDETTALKSLSQGFERKEIPETWPKGV